MSNFKYKKSIMYFSLFVKNFPLGTTEEELRIYFNSATQGDGLNKIQIVPGTTQAFINFEKQDQCKLAKEFAKNVLFKSNYALYVEYCYPKEMRQIRNEEIFDKRTQDRKKNQQTQAQIAGLNGSQNLIDLLTLLLKPAFQFNQNGGNQNRSRSMNNFGVNTPMGGGRQNMTSMPNQLGMQQRNGYQNHRTNFQGPNYRDGGNNIGMRHNSMGAGHMSQQQVAPPPNQMVNQSMVSSASSVSTTAPQFVDHLYAKQYFEEIQNMFMSPEFKNAKKKDKKEMVGNLIYKHVEKLVGDVKAPKITGMLIDLPEAELNFSIS